MNNSIDEQKEESIVKELMRHGRHIQTAPRDFTDRFMQKMNLNTSPVYASRPILNVRGKIAAGFIFLLLFAGGLSIGQEISAIPALDQANQAMRRFFNFDSTILLTTLVFSFAMLLAFNEFLKRRFAK